VERYEEVLKAIFFVKLLYITDLLGLADNVRRYGSVALCRGGTRFCTRGALQGYDVILFILALAKTVTPVGAPGGSRGRPWRQSRIFLLQLQSDRATERQLHIPTCWQLAVFLNVFRKARDLICLSIMVNAGARL
jgi:hypothetical protein